MLNDIEHIIGYSFSDKTILEIALTHKSVTSDQRTSEQGLNYERLEFLGDRVLNLVVADALLKAFPDESEGQIARRYSALVNRERLSDIAQNLGLGEHIRLSDAENNSGGQDKATILSDVVESIVGALYRDGGLDVAKQFVLQQIEPLLTKDLTPPIDHKTALQEWLQAKSNDVPSYEITDQTGPDHAPDFEVTVSVLDFPPQVAKAKSKKAAEKKAAKKMLQWIKDNKK